MNSIIIDELKSTDVDITYQISDWFIPENDKIQYDFSSSEKAREYTINIYGKNKDGISICTNVIGFKPFFYLKPPESWEDLSDSEFKLKVQQLQIKLLDEYYEYKFKGKLTKKKIISKFYEDHLCKLEIERKKDFWGFTNNKEFRFIKIVVKSLGLFNSLKYYFQDLKDGFILYEKYSRKDVCRILNWEFNEEATVYGYKLNNNTCPIFVNYHKEENIASSTKFPEKFLNSSQFLWYSKPQRRLSNPTLVSLRTNSLIRLPLFMKKHNGEGTDFYYMGDVQPIDHSFEETTIKNDKNRDVPVVKVILELKTPVERSIYNYLTYVNNNDTPAIEATEEKMFFEPRLINPIPLYDFYAAAGSFSEMQSNNDFTLIEGPINTNPNNDYFACKIIGESMNKVIPNGSICLFKKYSGGSRNGKIVLVENMDIQDQDFNSAFTIKTYSSEKEVFAEDWKHTSIVLRPNSFDDSFKNIIINEEDGAEMRVVGEFVKILM